MADKSLIGWTDATWNPVTGCEVTSPGCTNCYAMKLAGSRLKHHPSRTGLTRDSVAGPVWTGEVRFNTQWLEQPLQWRRPRKIFVVAHGDLFRTAVPDEWIDAVFSVMALARQHTFQVLTKHPSRALAYLRSLEEEPRLPKAADAHGIRPVGAAPGCWNTPMPHVWIGCSVENQRCADTRREAMSAITDLGWLTWVSYEPALGPVDWAGWSFLDWLVSGGEKGPGSRPAHPQWFRDSRDWCGEHGIAFNHKQNGDWGTDEVAAGNELGDLMRGGQTTCLRVTGEHATAPLSTGDLLMRRRGADLTGRLLDGRLHDEYPNT